MHAYIMYTVPDNKERHSGRFTAGDMRGS